MSARIFALTVISTVLAGCAAEVISSNPRSVTIRVGEVRVADAQKAAEAECAKYQRYARLTIRPTPATANYWVFDCVE